MPLSQDDKIQFSRNSSERNRNPHSRQHIASPCPDCLLSRQAGRTVFGSDISGYHNARPGYPDELFQMVAERLAGTELFGEIGPGTGLATTELLKLQPQRFVGFEPDAALASFLNLRFPSVEVINDDFCSAGIPGAFDLIASASSFHWLDAKTALRKAHELLRPGGCLAIWWNVYREADVGDLFAEAVTPLLRGLVLPPSQTIDHHYGLNQRLHFERLESNGFADLQFRLFRRERTLTPADARAMYASFSLVRVLPEPRREELLNDIAAIVSEKFDGAAASVLLTPLYLARKPASETG